MNCEDIRQNSAAYVLGALTEAEQAEFERHADECDLQHDLESLGDVVSRLSAAAPSIDPPSGLRDRILAAAVADSDADDSGANPVSTTDASPASTAIPPAKRGRFNLRQFSTGTYAAAAVMLIVIGVAIGWAASTIPGDDKPLNIRQFHREEDGDWLRVETELGRPELTLSVGNLDHLTEDNRYRFWAKRGENWIRIGDFNTNPEGRWSGDFNFALELGDAIAITIEPDGESDAPTVEAEIQSRI